MAQQKETDEWINNITRELEVLEEGPKAEIHTDLHKATLKKISNRKTPGHEGIRDFWFKKSTSNNDRLALERNKCIQKAHVPEWMSKGKTTLIQKGPNKRTALSNKLQTHNLPTNDVENINSTNKGRDLLFANKTRFVSWGTERVLQRIQRHTRITLQRSTHPNKVQDQTKKSSHGLDRLKNAYYMVRHSWIINSLKMYKISSEVINFIDKIMNTRRVKLTAGGRNFAEAYIQRGFFQGDALSPLLFINAMMSLNHILRKCTAGYKVSRSQERNQSLNIHGWH